MKHALALLLVLVLFSCTKEEERLNVRASVTCRMCAFQVNHDGEVKSDTIIGTLAYTGSGANMITDTIAATATHNFNAIKGSNIIVTACRLRADTSDGPITISVIGDIPTYTATADTGIHCGSVDLIVDR